MSLANICILKMSPWQGCSNGLREKVFYLALVVRMTRATLDISSTMNPRIQACSAGLWGWVVSGSMTGAIKEVGGTLKLN